MYLKFFILTSLFCVSLASFPIENPRGRIWSIIKNIPVIGDLFRSILSFLRGSEKPSNTGPVKEMNLIVDDFSLNDARTEEIDGTSTTQGTISETTTESNLDQNENSGSDRISKILEILMNSVAQNNEI